MLVEYLRKNAPAQSTLNRAFALWASAKLPDALNAEQKRSTVESIFSKQQADGGWSTSSLIPASWKRRDGTALDSQSDGYATGLITVVLMQSGTSRADARLKHAIAWLGTHQDAATGLWPSTSLNKQRDPASDAGRFMSDPATAFAVMALADTKQ